MSWKLKEKLRRRLLEETGAVRKDPGGRTSVCLVYPNEYRVGMGNLAVHAIYDILNRRSDIVCERAFLPDEIRRRSPVAGRQQPGPGLMSMESQRPLSEFDVVAFTISFENDYLNILPILSLAGIPFRAGERNSFHPLLIAGGIAPTLNPAPISAIFDSIIPGEFEVHVNELPSILKQEAGSRKQDKKTEKSFHASCVMPHASKRLYVRELNDWPTQTTIYNDNAEFGNMHLIEVQRGCPRKCKFCATPALYNPFRFRSAEAVLKMVDEGLKHRKKFGLIGADILSHPEFVEIATAIHARGGTFSPSSVRVDAIDGIRARLLSNSKHKSIALGIEAGSENLRNKTGKNISDDQILEAVALLSRNGITRIRLYFMIGLPDETDNDIEAIALISKRVLDTIRNNAAKGEGSHLVDITISPFIPKPHTPFENELFAGEMYLKDHIKSLKRILRNENGISINSDSAVDATVEALLARGGPETFAFLEEVFRSGNVRKALKIQNPRSKMVRLRSPP